jgi:hypothetical protein
MTTLDSWLERVPVDRITREAREVQFTRTVLTLIAGLFWLVGWSVGKAFTAVWLALAFIVTAVRLGWSDARPVQSRS